MTGHSDMAGAPRILFVDDDPQVREFVEDILGTNFPGIHIAMAKDQTSFRLALESGGFQVVVTDYELGWSDGLTIFRAVKARCPDCPVIMFTASGDEELAVEAMKAGLDDYVLKSPKHAVRLPAVLRQVMQQTEERRLRRDAEARNRTLINDVLETSATGVIILDANFHVVWVNGAIEQYFGINRSDLLGQDKRRLVNTRIKLIFQDGDDFERRVLSTYRNNQGTEAFDCHVLAGEGRQDRWLEHRSMPIRSGLYAGGRIQHYYDVTERKRAEDAMRASQHRLRNLIDGMGPSMFAGLLTPDGTVIETNRPSLAIAGLKAEDVLGKPFEETYWWSYSEEAKDQLRKAIERAAHGEGSRYDVQVRVSENRFIIIDFSLQPLRDETGRIVFLVPSAVDITERKRAEETLRIASETMGGLIQASPVAVTMLDAQGTVQVWNPAAERLFGWTASEIIGRRLPTIPPDGMEEHRTIIRRLLAGEALSGVDLVRQHKDGSKVAISLWASPLRSPEGEVTGIIGVMHDVTERKLMALHAARIERMAALGQLLSGVAHELKNPLFVLCGRLQLIREKLAAGQQDSLPHDLEKVEEAAKRMTHVTERFLTMARPLPPRQTACALPALLDQTLEFMANELMKSKVEVSTDISHDLPIIVADPRLLQEAFLNLMLNALHAMVTAHRRGRLTVAARQVSEWIEIRIEDDGPGIPPEHRGRLFEPFFSTKPAGEGTGLGLWTVRTIVEGMKGQVAYETEMDRGTTFIIRLPVNDGNGGNL